MFVGDGSERLVRGGSINVKAPDNMDRSGKIQGLNVSHIAWMRERKRSEKSNSNPTFVWGSHMYDGLYVKYFPDSLRKMGVDATGQSPRVFQVAHKE